jgi:hypothetical protein
MLCATAERLPRLIGSRSIQEALGQCVPRCQIDGRHQSTHQNPQPTTTNRPLTRRPGQITSVVPSPVPADGFRSFADRRAFACAPKQTITLRIDRFFRARNPPSATWGAAVGWLRYLVIRPAPHRPSDLPAHAMTAESFASPSGRF